MAGLTAPGIAAIVVATAAVAGCAGMDAHTRSPTDSRLLVFNSSIGDVRLQTTRARVQRVYGRPDRRAVLRDYFPIGTRYEGKVLVRATYDVHRGTLVIGYIDGVVKTVSTTSGYYRTARGIRVGTRLPRDRCFRRDYIGHIGPRGCKNRWRGFDFEGECVNAWLSDKGRVTTALQMGLSRRIRGIEIGDHDVTLYCF
jgi:hypothetical protein